MTRFLAIAFALSLGALPVAAATGTSLVTLEGTVLELGEEPGEGRVPVLIVEIEVQDATRRRLALAPPSALRELGFEVEKGDVLRVAAFAGSTEPLRVQKVRNVTRRTMLRLRSLSALPLWDAGGRWQGGPCRGGAGGHRHRRGGARR